MQYMTKENIVLIGMPGVGKSTIGVILAKVLGFEFVDSDLEIQKAEGKLLKDIIQEQGTDGFVEVENRINSRLNVTHSVIATGGSVVYGAEAMDHLKKIGTVVYLKQDFSVLKKRLHNIRGRGVVLKPGQTLEDIYKERCVLYEKYADVTIDEYGLDIEETLALVQEKLEAYSKRQRTQQIERSIIKKFRKTIWRKFTKAINEYQLIQENDKIAVCISGGKDSMLMAKLFQELQRHGKIPFEVVFLVMNPGYNEKNWQLIQENARILGIPLTVFDSEIFEIVTEVEQNPCYLCARMRRGHLYAHAKELGCNKIALGHHFDDVIETTLMGMFYAGKIETMMPKLHSQNFEGMELIRPMYLITEAAIKDWRDYNHLEFIQCACRFTEMYTSEGGGSGSKRDEIKQLIASLREKSELIDRNIFRSVHNINLNTIIGYHKGDQVYHFLDDYDQDIDTKKL